MKASSGGCQSQTQAATTQLFVLKTRVTQRHEAHKARRDGERKGLLAKKPCSKIKPEDYEHSLTDVLEKHSLHW